MKIGFDIINNILMLPKFYLSSLDLNVLTVSDSEVKWSE